MKERGVGHIRQWIHDREYLLHQRRLKVLRHQASQLRAIKQLSQQASLIQNSLIKCYMDSDKQPLKGRPKLVQASSIKNFNVGAENQNGQQLKLKFNEFRSIDKQEKKARDLQRIRLSHNGSQLDMTLQILKLKNYKRLLQLEAALKKSA